ncbi:cupin [Pseudomonas aeruginosa]|nr:cupin [Pseudomonas aeruginosa]
MNDYQFKLVKIEGDFVWHSHADTDETFIVLAGRLRIDFRDGAVHLGPGEMYVGAARRGAQTVRRGARCACSWWSPAACANTGDQGGERTAVNDLWI